MQCDVVVVGAGPAGSTAAYLLACEGADVLLVDQARFPRDKPCGGGLTPRTVELLEQMGLAESAICRGRAFAGVDIIAPNGRHFSFDLLSKNGRQPRRGLIVYRHEFDDALRQQAEKAGARFLPGFHTTSPHLHHGQLAGVEGRCGSDSRTIQARLVILATGANRTLVKAFGLASQDKPSGLALRAFLTNVDGLNDHLEIYLERALVPGYAWIFPTGERTANVGVGLRLDGARRDVNSHDLRAAFDHLRHSPRLASGQLLGSPQGLPLQTDFPAIPTFASGLLVAGEAVGLVNPLTGEGIALALESGQLAAQVASQALRSGNLDGDYLRQYDTILREKHAGYFEDARELLARLSSSQVMDALVQCSLNDPRIGEAFTTAILDEQPRSAITRLTFVLSEDAKQSTAAPLFTLGAYQPLLDRCRAYMLEQVRKDAPSPLIVQLLERGKMLRALLVFIGCRSAGGDPAQVLSGAAGIELVHAASLIHDDIMDDAPQRRGLPALHTALGTAQAIVCGDYLIAKSFRLLAESRNQTAAARVIEAFIIGAESGIRTCAGQFQDVGEWSDETLNEEQYDQLIVRKTAAPIAGALMAGAALAGGTESLLTVLSRYGECVGRAFQIRDDVLDLTDVSNGHALDHKPMLPLIHAYQHGDDRARALIRQFLNNQEVSVGEAAELLRQNGSINYANQVAGALVEKALVLAATLPHVQGELEAFARYVLVRDH